MGISSSSLSADNFDNDEYVVKPIIARHPSQGIFQGIAGLDEERIKGK